MAVERARPTTAATGADDPLPHLDTFARAAELGTFTGAAKVLGVTQAAVSQRIQALERVVGKSLFQRKGGRVLLTDAGRRLYGYVEQILDLHRAARKDVAGRDAPVAGELLLGASSVPGEHFLPALLAEFGRTHPHIRVRATIGDSMGVIGQVERGEVSLGLVGRQADRPHLDFRFLASDRMVFVVPPGHPLAARKRASVRGLLKHPLVLREVGSGLRHCFEQSLEKVGRSLSDFRIGLELGSNEAIKEAVLRGAGVAVLSLYAVEREERAGRLRAVEAADLHCDRDMFVVRDRRRVLPLPARLFLSFLEAHPMPPAAGKGQ